MTYLVDTGSYARNRIEPYRAMARFLSDRGFEVHEMESLSSVEAMQTECSSKYGTMGLQFLREIPDRAVDLIWSQAVLKHVRAELFLDIMCELRRVIRDDAICSHRVDLKDHLGGALNNLKYSDRFWEAPLELAGCGKTGVRCALSPSREDFRPDEGGCGYQSTRSQPPLGGCGSGKAFKGRTSAPIGPMRAPSFAF